MPHELSQIGGGSTKLPPLPAKTPGVLDRIGESLLNPSLAFLNDQSLAQFEKDKGQQALLETQVEGNRQQNEAARVAAEEKQQIQELSRIAFGGGPKADVALNELFARDPLQADRLFEGLGAKDQASREEAARDASAIQALPPEQRRPAILERAARIEAEGRDATETLSLLGMDPETQTNQLRIIQAAALSAAQRQAAAGGGGTPAEQASFEALIAGMTPADQKKARRIKAGLDPRAGSSSTERIALSEELAALVAASQAQIAGQTQTAKTEAQIAAELAAAEETGAAAARQAALVEAATQGEKIKANRVKTAEEARILLPESQAGAKEMTTLLTSIRDDPKLADVLGPIEGRIDIRLDSDEIALLAKIDQVLGKTFLEAYQSLKGGGPITDREGQAATEAQSRLTNRAVSLPAYIQAIDELIDQTDNRIGRLTRKANLGAAPTVEGFTVEEVTE